MEQTVYSNPKVASLSSDVIFVKLNVDRTEGNQFAGQNGVSGLPTTVILNHNGSVVNKFAGYISSPDQFIRLVQKSLPRR